MNFTLMPSLKHIALVKVTTELWNLRDVRDLVARSSTGYSDYSNKYEEWRELVEDKVMKKVPELPLPDLLKSEILYSVRPIGLEIYKWKTYLCENRSLGRLLSADEYIKLSSVPCWTPQGTVDQKKTAQALVKDDNLDITKRYILACNLCLEDDIKEMWNSLPQTKKVAFYDEGLSSFSNVQHRLVVLWTYDIKGEIAKLNALFKDDHGREITAYRYAFQIAVIDGNKTATEYFFQKLTPVERQESLVRYAEYIAKRRRVRTYPLYADVLCFLLSQMNEEQQVKVFEGDSHEVLSSLLDWPWQSFFLEAANRTWDLISDQDYVCILRDIIKKIRLGFKDCNYHKLFSEFWRQGPSTCKKYFIERCASDLCLLYDLFQLEGKEKIRLILKIASVKEKENIIFHEGKKICRTLIYLDKWDLLKFFVQECLSSENVLIKFKNEFEHGKHLGNYAKFYQFLDDLIRKNSKKRNVEEGNSCNTAKRRK